MKFVQYFFLVPILVAMTVTAAFIEPLERNWTDLMTRTVQSMHRSLAYLASVQPSLTVDGLLGVIIVKHQTDSLITLHHNWNSLGTLQLDRSHLHQLNTDLLQLNEHAKQIISVSISHIFFKDPLYFQGNSFDYVQTNLIQSKPAVGGLLNGALWSRIYCQPRPLTANQSSYLTWKDEPINLELTEGLSDVCLSEIFNGCHISTFCWNLLLIPRYKDYRLAHQVLYLMAAKAMNCIPLTYKETVEQQIGLFCKLIYEENVKIQQSRYKQEDQDLFMENIAFCGYNGFIAFRTNYRWLEEILKWQIDSQGCYNVDLGKVAQLLETSATRTKRRETVFRDGCSLHKTSMALAATCIYLQQLTLDLTERINFNISLGPK